MPEGYLTLSVTGQPDFAHLVVDYVPGSWLLERQVVEALSGILP
jgi:NADPH-dependent 7-cyano-7-deazaguanine reductase QueF